jgi:hypothetical protein
MTLNHLRKLRGLLHPGYSVQCRSPTKMYIYEMQLSYLYRYMSVNSLLLFLQVFLKQGPYGYYVQVGEDKKGMCPKRAALSADVIIALIFK